MTLDELKAEAKKLGYKVIKDNPRVKLLPCTCGRKQISLWWDGADYMWFQECPKCGKRAPSHKTQNGARKLWNEKIEKELANGN